MAIEDEMRGVLAGHREECGERAEQLMVNNHLYPDEIEAWLAEVERLRAVEAAARVAVAEVEPDLVDTDASPGLGALIAALAADAGR